MGDRVFDVYNESILLIGPPNVGKSEVSAILSERTNLKVVSLESTRDKYYNEIGYDKKYANKLKKEEGFLARYKYWKKFESYHVSKFLPTLKEPSIVKFEASQTVYEDEALFNEVKNVMKKFKNIVLLLPDIDLQDCWSKINKNGKVPIGSDLSKLNWHLVSSPCNSNLATMTVCICGRSSDEIVDEILSFVDKNKKLVNN